MVFPSNSELVQSQPSWLLGGGREPQQSSAAPRDEQAAAALHIPPADIRREESKALQALRRDRRVMALEYLAGAAYEGTGWNAWYYRRGSVEERLVERG